MSLPSEVLFHILSNLSIPDLFPCRQVSYQFNEISSFLLNKKLQSHISTLQTNLKDQTEEFEEIRRVNLEAQQTNSNHLRLLPAHTSSLEEVKRYARPTEEVHRIFQYLLVLKGDVSLAKNGAHIGLLPWAEIRKSISTPSFKQWLAHLEFTAGAIPPERVLLLHFLFNQPKVRDSLQYHLLARNSKPGYFMLIILAALVRHVDLKQEVDDKESEVTQTLKRLNHAFKQLQTVS